MRAHAENECFSLLGIRTLLNIESTWSCFQEQAGLPLIHCGNISDMLDSLALKLSIMTKYSI